MGMLETREVKHTKRPENLELSDQRRPAHRRTQFRNARLRIERTVKDTDACRIHPSCAGKAGSRRGKLADPTLEDRDAFTLRVGNTATIDEAFSTSRANRPDRIPGRPAAIDQRPQYLVDQPGAVLVEEAPFLFDPRAEALPAPVQFPFLVTGDLVSSGQIIIIIVATVMNIARVPLGQHGRESGT
jgi:hypothetical protein